MPERTYRHVDTTRTHTIGSVEQFLRGTGGDSSRMSSSYSPTSTNSPSSPYFERLKQHDPEDDHGLYQKKSVLTKVKEKARKLRNSLSKRRLDENFTPSWGVSLDDDHDEEEEVDAEYLGAPMYESELAPEGYKENARQHPRANPVISEKHVLHNTVKLGVEHDREKPCFTNATTTPNMSQVYGGGSNAAALSLGSKLQTVVSTQTPANINTSSQTSSLQSPMRNSPSSTVSLMSGRNTNQRDASFSDYLINQPDQGDDANTTLSPMQNSPSSSASILSGNQKGVLVTDYLVNKSEQEDDAKTNLSPMQNPSYSSASILSGKNIIQKSASIKDYPMNKSEPRDDAKTVPSILQNSLSSLAASLNAKNIIQKSASIKDYQMNNTEPRDDAKTTLSPIQNSSTSSASLSVKNIIHKSASIKDYPMNIFEPRRDDAKTLSSLQHSSSSSASLSGKNTSQKSALLRDYSMNKSEPRDDMKTVVSQPQVTSEAMSPRKSSSNGGVLEKVKGAVNSLLGNEEPSQQYGVKIATKRNSPQTPQVGQEENCGRILQAN